jgi:hypothetical protein
VEITPDGTDTVSALFTAQPMNINIRTCLNLCSRAKHIKGRRVDRRSGRTHAALADARGTEGQNRRSKACGRRLEESSGFAGSGPPLSLTRLAVPHTRANQLTRPSRVPRPTRNTRDPPAGRFVHGILPSLA